MVAVQNRGREHHWDMLRAALMLLGIPYHVAMCYRAGEVWIARSGEGALIFTWLSDFIHLFRMPAFFMVAGYFAALLLARRDAAEWLRGRCGRLGVPLIVSLVTLVPLLNILCELSNFPLRAALASWRDNASTSGGYDIRHLWFIIVLLYLSLAAAGLVKCFPRLRAASVSPRVDAWAARHVVVALLGIATLVGLWEAWAIELFHMAGLATNVPQEVLRIDQLLAFTPWFLLGWLLARAPQLRQRFLRLSPSVALIALASSTVLFGLANSMSPAAGRFVESFAALALTQLAVALTKRFADQPSPMVTELVTASFVIYLVHLPIAVGLMVAGQQVAMPVAAKAVLIMLLTLLLSYGAWRVVASSPRLRFLFDGVQAPAAERPRRLQPV